MRSRFKLGTFGIFVFLLNNAFAQPVLKPIGASFVEAPPGRDKNLVPFGFFGNSQEKVEVHAVLSINGRLLIDLVGSSREQDVKSSAQFGDKSNVDIGSAEIASFPKLSADKKQMLITISVNRLPDKAISAVSFAGKIKVRSAAKLVNKTVNFEPKPGTKIDFGIGDVTIGKIEGSTISLKGGDGLENIAALKFISSDGRIVSAERAGYSRLGSNSEYEWRFTSPLTVGKLEAALYDGLDTVEVPIKLRVAKPY